jgi:hypothetical protein
MKDNVLKKEFAKKDVQRLRNVLSGKAGSRTQEGIGYTKATEFHKEGDIWTENGREWTIKDGIKQNITKLDKAKKLAMPMFCPSCNKIMKSNNDKLFWSNHRRCFNCQIDFEHELKLNGLWDDYVKNMNNQGIDSFKENYINWVEDMINSSNQGFVSENGEVENWKGGVNKELAYKTLNETIEYLESLKK